MNQALCVREKKPVDGYYFDKLNEYEFLHWKLRMVPLNSVYSKKDGSHDFPLDDVHSPM